MSDRIKKITVHAELVDTTYDEWDYIKDAIGTLATFAQFGRVTVEVERADVREGVGDES